MKAADLWVIRHGETEWNVAGIWQGQMNSPLTEKGRKQAARIADHLEGYPIDEIYSSDLGRCIETATPAANKLGLELNMHHGLRERGFGVLEGLEKEESLERFPDVWEKIESRDPEFRPERGESLREKQRRFEETFLEIAEKSGGRTVVLFTHGGGVDALVRMLFEIPLDAPRNYTLWNGAINRVRYDGKWTLGTLGELSHLRGLESAFRAR